MLSVFMLRSPEERVGTVSNDPSLYIKTSMMGSGGLFGGRGKKDKDCISLIVFCPLEGHARGHFIILLCFIYHRVIQEEASLLIPPVMMGGSQPVNSDGCL